jgi:hypothetical protein
MLFFDEAFTSFLSLSTIFTRISDFDTYEKKFIKLHDSPYDSEK